MAAATIILVSGIDNNRTRCACCGESIRMHQTRATVCHTDGRKVRGEAYCDDAGCIEIAIENNSDTLVTTETFKTVDDYHVWCDFADSQAEAEAEREAYAAYHVAGATAAYWQDRDAGLVP